MREGMNVKALGVNVKYYRVSNWQITLRLKPNPQFRNINDFNRRINILHFYMVLFKQR